MGKTALVSRSSRLMRMFIRTSAVPFRPGVLAGMTCHRSAVCQEAKPEIEQRVAGLECQSRSLAGAAVVVSRGIVAPRRAKATPAQPVHDEDHRGLLLPSSLRGVGAKIEHFMGPLSSEQAEPRATS
jgi:hypothetical protein